MLLGLDLGTTNVKAALADDAGHLLRLGSAVVQLCPLAGGGVEQDLEEIWSATRTAIQQATSGHDAAAVRAVGVSSQGGALQLLDEQGQPLGSVVSWLDDRGRRDDERLTDELGQAWFRRRIGHGRSGLAIGQVLRLRCEHPSWLTPAQRVGFVGDCIVERLCGRAAHDATSCGLTLLYNPARRSYDPEVLARLGLREAQLPALLAPRAGAGVLRSEAARQTGLPAGIPVSPAIHDQYAAALGTGVVNAGEVMFGAGTAWVLLVVMDQLAEPVIDEAFVCNHPIAGLHGQIISLRNGGSAVSWAKKLLGLDTQPGFDLDAALASVKPGCDGVGCWPFLAAYGAAGVPAETGGRLVGLQLSHTPAHVLRAVVEGLAYELNRHLDFLRQARASVQKLVMSGGAASSRVTPQIVADVTGLPVECANVAEASVVGAVVLARALVEPERELKDLALEIVPAPRVVTPGESASFYQAKYREYVESLRISSPPPGERIEVRGQ